MNNAPKLLELMLSLYLSGAKVWKKYQTAKFFCIYWLIGKDKQDGGIELCSKYIEQKYPSETHNSGGQTVNNLYRIIYRFSHQSIGDGEDDQRKTDDRNDAIWEATGEQFSRHTEEYRMRHHG